ncbi:MAG: DUF3604 domain-containing protein [bacterium]|nr:DUF3604 domain-containing protein [bacterium]
MLKKTLFGLAILLALVLLGLYIVGIGTFGTHEGPGEVLEAARPEAVVESTQNRVSEAADVIGVPRPKQVLFGDLHVHTTFSFDAFMMSLPIQQGEGAHPPADACDFARYCSALDFWSINDHAASISPEAWRETVDSIRRCNDVAGDPDNPDTVAYLGWEWTHVGTTSSNHWGHKNVVLKGLEDVEITKRPIAAASTLRMARQAARFNPIGVGAFLLTAGDSRFHDLTRFFAEREGLEICEDGIASPSLPEDCMEAAETPADLYRKLDEWGVDSIVIPHGTTWGFYTPVRSSWDKQLAGDQHDPKRQTMLEIYSGHGDSDVYRDWRALDLEASGEPVCPEPRDGYLPTCWQAGEIIRGRCLEAGESEAECEDRAVVARKNAALAGQQAHLTVPGATAAEWLDAGQCRDCDQPSFNYRPGGSAQYIMAISNFDDPENPRRFRLAFMGSSDNHFARPGTGYKEIRHGMTESRDRTGLTSSPLASILAADPVEPAPRSVPFDRESSDLQAFALFELERQASFFMTGGLIATHAEGRDRGSIWEAMQRREVYGTSGPRMLLWFDLLNPPGTVGRTLPMGGEIEMGENPIFQVRAVGSFEQSPGCPDYAVSALGTEEIDRVCKGECYNPSNERRPITRIDVIRIQPQQRPGEPVSDLIQDPWKSFECDPDPAGCVATFEDPEYVAGSRDTLYYARAYEAESIAVNAGGVRCEYDADGNCIHTSPCGNDPGDECLSAHEPRAWSSPIFVDWKPPVAID